MTLQDYLTAEFGIVPDEMQLEAIRRIVYKELNTEKKFINERFMYLLAKSNGHNVTQDQFVDLPHMGFSLIKTND